MEESENNINKEDCNEENYNHITYILDEETISQMHLTLALKRIISKQVNT